MINPQIRLLRQPQGMPVETDFELVDAGEPQGDGELCHTLYISIDPYLRGRLSGRHLTGRIAPGTPMESELVLRTPDGQLVRGFGPWQQRLRLPVTALSPIPAACDPPSLALGVLGMPGLTAYAGVTRLLQPQAGQTLLVSAAAGAVGASVGQLARQAGARIVGIAGSEAKCSWLSEVAGFDATINYRQQGVREGIHASCPDGVDLYFDNVGGDVLNGAMESLNPGARVVLCGLMEQYNLDTPPPGPNPALIIKARATVHGLVVYDHEDLRQEMIDTIAALIADNRFVYREAVWNGLEQAPQAFCTLMRGQNFGKCILDVQAQA